MSELSDQLLALEAELALPSFSNADALALGLAAVDFIHRTGKPGVYIEVRRNGSVIFSHCMDGAAPENRCWVGRKLRTVTLFEHCTLYAGEKLRMKGRNFYDYYPPDEYQMAGGGFPIAIPGAGMIGMIGVSGLTAEEDNQVCVEALRALIAGKKL